MLKQIKPLLLLFISFLGVFILQKFLFLLYHSSIYNDLNGRVLLHIIKAGFPLDLSLSCYLLAIPLIIHFFSTFRNPYWIRNILYCYLLGISILISFIFILDLHLFSYWGFRLDTTPIFYFLSSPKSALASISLYEMCWALLALFTTSYLIYKLLITVSSTKNTFVHKYKQPTLYRVVLLLSMGLCFLGIRGGWTVSTMNTGTVYFSSKEHFNQAAINPIFSLLESSLKEQNFAEQFQYFSPDTAKKILKELYTRKDSVKQFNPLISKAKPDIYILILESFSVPLMRTTIKGKEITPHLNQIAQSSIYFSNFYANSFRTDRGLVSILSGYPSQPNTSIMKYPRKAQKLPSIQESLKEAGYYTSYFYGGDINFTNLKAYLKSSGVENIISDQDFPIYEKLSKWGAHDHILFQKIITELCDNQLDQPRLNIIQTSSSHEPFEVPFHRFEDKRANSFAYTDHCIEQFITALKTKGLWDNSLILITSDHQGAYPKELKNTDLERYHIPLIWTGGAVNYHALEISTIGSQMDIAATLLEQMDIEAHKFYYSKNITDNNAPHFAYFSFPNLAAVWNNQSGALLNLSTDDVLPIGSKGSSDATYIKALLQSIYLDLNTK